MSHLPGLNPDLSVFVTVAYCPPVSISSNAKTAGLGIIKVMKIKKVNNFKYMIIPKDGLIP